MRGVSSATLIITLVHDFRAALLQGDKTQLAALRNLDGFGESEFVDPERQNGFDFFHEQDWGDAFHVHDLLSSE